MYHLVVVRVDMKIHKVRPLYILAEAARLRRAPTAPCSIDGVPTIAFLRCCVIMIQCMLPDRAFANGESYGCTQLLIMLSLTAERWDIQTGIR